MWSVDLRPARPVNHHVGGRISLALVNSLEWRRGEPVEKIPDYEALADFFATVGGLPLSVAESLKASAATAGPVAARAALDRAVALREALFRLFSAVAAGSAPDPADADTLSHLFADGMRHLALDAALRPEWTGLDLPAWEAAADAVALLNSPARASVKQCPGETCGWVFVDESRNHSRTWCDSRMCGNRARARRHYAKQRAARA
jgi:predicted RNA-binding Zn ribbon-like protein